MLIQIIIIGCFIKMYITLLFFTYSEVKLKINKSLTVTNFVFTIKFKNTIDKKKLREKKNQKSFYEIERSSFQEHNQKTQSNLDNLYLFQVQEFRAQNRSPKNTAYEDSKKRCISKVERSDYDN
ncbi:unnamed protein product [Paramecium pentaurelia]|uniref:Transmembrane protein n=1 Tax=Paramecium pentaurelia TaxID=43138 RepID=A0A8S1SVP0_9CILI|nr:unnamed protein product [Paramecium pentaurelia]